jgi:uncharacterized protein
MLLIQSLMWETKNISHIARHNVIPEEVDEVCYGNHVVRQSKFGRLFIIGPTLAGRMLTVIIEHRHRDTFYPVTARDATEKEIKKYKAAIGGSS